MGSVTSKCGDLRFSELWVLLMNTEIFWDMTPRNLIHKFGNFQRRLLPQT